MVKSKGGKPHEKPHALKAECMSNVSQIMNAFRDLLKRPVQKFIADPAMKVHVDAAMEAAKACQEDDDALPWHARSYTPPDSDKAVRIDYDSDVLHEILYYARGAGKSKHGGARDKKTKTANTTGHIVEVISVTRLAFLALQAERFLSNGNKAARADAPTQDDMETVFDEAFRDAKLAAINAQPGRRLKICAPEPLVRTAVPEPPGKGRTDENDGRKRLKMTFGISSAAVTAALP